MFGFTNDVKSTRLPVISNAEPEGTEIKAPRVTKKIAAKKSFIDPIVSISSRLYGNLATAIPAANELTTIDIPKNLDRAMNPVRKDNPVSIINSVDPSVSSAICPKMNLRMINAPRIMESPIPI